MNLEICYEISVSYLWTRVQVPPLWLSSVNNLRASHLSSLSCHFFNWSHRDSTPLWRVTKSDNLHRGRTISTGSLFILPVYRSLDFALSQRVAVYTHSYTLEVSAFSPESLGRRFSDQRLKTQRRLKRGEQVEKPTLCSWTLPCALVFLSLNCCYNSGKQEFFKVCMRNPSFSENDWPCK